MATHKRSVDFTAPQYEWLQAEAQRLGITVADVVRRIIDEHRLKKPETRK